MCPMMSFVATVLYNGINAEFFANWMQKLVFNFPFAFFVELFFVQPIVRTVFRLIFKNKESNLTKQTTVPTSMGPEPEL